MRELIVDNFAGGGGASTGIELALGRSPDIAINHNPDAIAMHALNHPNTKHYCEDVWNVDPIEATAGRPVGLAWFSPDCTHFSKAKGGKPKSQKIRGLAGVVTKWAELVRPRLICLENVEEFADWGPLLPNGQPCPIRKGQTFREWWRELEKLGYELDARELVACDYGAPTSRKRLFIIGRCDGQAIRWPEPTHGSDRGLLPYRTAAECIDWSVPCPSIFLSKEEAKKIRVKRPLEDATLRRVARGVMRYVVNARQPFLVLTLRGTQESHISSSAQSVDQPLRTISAGGTHHALLAPVITPLTHQGERRVHPGNEPLPTVTGANRGELALTAATLINTRNGERHGRHGEQAPRIFDIRKPYSTVTAQGSQGALVAAFLARHYGGHENDGQDVRAPISTITSKDHHHLVHAFLLKYYGTDQDPKLREPLHTITSKDRFGLVTVESQQYYIADIGMRMLQPTELFRAQGFPESVKLIGGKTKQVALCGNSVSPPVAAAIVRANMLERAEERAA